MLRWFIILLFLGTVESSFAVENELKIGMPAPELIGREAAGPRLLKLSALMKEVGFERNPEGRFREVNGKYVVQVTRNAVVLNFFATTCIPCIREIPSFNRVATRFQGKPVKLLYVNVDPELTEEKIRYFIEKLQIQVPMMLPNQQHAIETYGVQSLPRLVLINREGVIDKILTGFQDDLEQQLEKWIEGLL
ncbi:MAG: TlpA family protein disulfide reductase [SAR324 cluster bacterium]|nr:TlpA family protein disulfide reductase [SAR324 cluster bacterium]